MSGTDRFGLPMTVREEFEHLLISPNGIHHTREDWAEHWQQPWGDAELETQIARATEYLQLCHRTKNVNPSAGSSYGFKHRVEEWRRSHLGAGNHYVSNGCFIMAAVRLGFKIKHPSDRGPNCYFNIGKPLPAIRRAA